MRLALYQPDIPQNLGTLLRCCACFGVDMDIIEPCGFPLDDRKIKRAGMDYIDKVSYKKHASYEEFNSYIKENNFRPVLLTTKASSPYHKFSFSNKDVLILGRESAGVPDEIHEKIENRIIIPMQEGLRSLNVAISGSIVLAEGLRQTGMLP